MRYDGLSVYLLMVFPCVNDDKKVKQGDLDDAREITTV